ncbi:MAG: hypothetical protein LBI33_08685 [Propionibacteriaceae bacterium]|jgi:molybdopterin molybdotransferase|nr:hypothetical protein [Propionibacteriaceae bacterium]
MALFKHRSTPVEAELTPEESVLPLLPPPAKDGVRDFWQHWDFLLGMVPSLAEFGVPVLDSVGLTLNESILAVTDLGPVKAGEVVIDKGTKVIPRLLPLLTGMGISKVMARPSPRVIVAALTTEAGPASYLAAGLAQAAGAQAHRLEFVFTDEADLVGAITEQLVRADLVVTVGGLGEPGLDLTAIAHQIGPHDFTPVAVSPGRDHGFILAEEKVPLLALPGDVYGTFVLAKLLLEPMIGKLMGAAADPDLFGTLLAQPLRIAPNTLTCVPATIEGGHMTITGRPTGLAGMYDIYRADALAVLASEDGFLAAESEAFYLPLG